ncbi:DUF6478 family protein [Jannaschia seohaensis]|uniref:Uncharacterized protein n=1 Tax=Jannaschia seohaensis TaxID=475081 RepID=A0A2Y9AU59_9RHOB|nr:DUF6478 family protein [Jannaschia seohaensis]PWJ17461.1 hypothetical protein BCF38_10671 [Jannaschia seohaensis]SSA47525.1 hypothetical protein SAMN05421539_10671 [Jannaschia seohaensis]
MRGAAGGGHAPRSDPAVTDRPALADWAWRPVAWSRPLGGMQGPIAPGGQVLAPGCTLFHDDRADAVALHQRATPEGPTAFALELTLSAFAGSYLSFAIDLPRDAATTLTRSHVLRIDAVAQGADALFARLNLRHGPDTDALTDRLRPEGAGLRTELDLGFTPLAAGGVTAAWVDLSLSPTTELSVTLTDLVLTRRPRAEL